MNGTLLARWQRAAILASAVLLFALRTDTRADWLQYRGPTQNGISPESGFSAEAANSPKILWKNNVGKGTSAVTVSGNRAYTMGNTGSHDVIYCFDPATGKPIWQHKYPIGLDPNLFEGGPRATPTIDGKYVFTVSHQGDLWCLDAGTGQKIWYQHYQRDFHGRRMDWGFSGSPLVHGNLLLLDVGAQNGSTVAVDKHTGKVVWKSGGDMPGYGTPLVATIEGRPTLVMFKAEALVGYDLKDGKELWRSGWKTSYDINAATPLVIGDNKLFISSGYNAGCALVQISGGKAKELWRNKKLRAHINTPVAWEGHIYGIDGNTGGGNLVCLDAASGERKWEEKTVKGGSLIAAAGKLIVFTEKGDLVICEANSGGFRVLGRSHVLDHRCWTQPTLDAGRLFLRNNEGDLVCLDLSGR